MDIVVCKPENTAFIEAGSKAPSLVSVKVVESQVMCGDTIHSSLAKVEEAQGPIAEKVPKKPDKVLPCPRCHSFDTKFCYFNNYNVNQPRHFCRKCQRYWTAGGTLRNVPVGAGRRKNKHFASHQKHVMVSNGMSIRSGTSEIARHHRFPGSNVGTAKTFSNLSEPQLHVLPLETPSVPNLHSPSAASSSLVSFGQENPLCKSMAATTLSMQENGAVPNHGMADTDGIVASEVFALSGKHSPESDACTSSHKMLPPCLQTGPPVITEVIAGAQVQEGELKENACNGNSEMQAFKFAPSVNGVIWEPGSSAVPVDPLKPMIATSLDCESSCTTAPSSNTGPYLPSPNVLACNRAVGGFWPGLPWPYMNPTLWGAPPTEWAGPWTIPMHPPGVAAAAAALLPYPGVGSPAQKHHLPERSQPEKCLWVPKTLRIDDPLNATRSSIWTTLGLGDGSLSSMNGSSLTSTCQTKPDFKDDKEAVNSSRLSNPAALSRSAAFHENS